MPSRQYEGPSRESRPPERQSRWRSLRVVWAAAATAAVGLVGLAILQRSASVPAGGAESAFVGGDLHSVVVDPTNSEHLFVGGHGSAAVSTDGGRTFRQIGDLQNVDAMSWAVAPDGREMVVGGHGGLHASNDGGTHWADLTDPLPGSDVHSVGLDPSAPSHWWVFVVGRGVYATTDSGHSWAAIGGADLMLMGPIVATPGGSVLVGPDMQAGTTRSTDGGRSWNHASGGAMASWLAAEPGKPSHLIAVGPTGLQESTDTGSTWHSVAEAPADITAAGIGRGGGTWYAAALAGSSAKVYRSTDAGRSWQPTN